MNDVIFLLGMGVIYLLVGGLMLSFLLYLAYIIVALLYWLLSTELGRTIAGIIIIVIIMTSTH